MNLLSFIFPITYKTYKSKYNGEIKLKEVLGQKGIYVDNFPQSGDFMERMWKRVVWTVKERMPDVENCLLLGVGGGTFIKILKSRFPNAKILGVDIDPVMIHIAKKHFQIDAYKDVKLVVSDAFDWVERQGKREKYNLIVIDVFIGRKNMLISERVKFLRIIKKMLAKSGLVVLNTDYKEKEEKEIRQFIKNCQKVFSTVSANMKYSQNSILLLS